MPRIPTRESDMDTEAPTLDDLLRHLVAIETALQLLVRERTVKEWYTTAEVATILGRAEFTVREWCRLGRIRARKKLCGRGKGGEWLVSHAELTRVRNEGLLPIEPPSAGAE